MKTWVLNLVINGIPSIRKAVSDIENELGKVLNLVINGIPSIRENLFIITFI